MTARDGIGDQLTKIVEWLNFYRLERSQMYGIVINLMVELGMKELTLTLDDMNFARDYMLHMTPNEDNKALKIELVEHVYDEEG